MEGDAYIHEAKLVNFDMIKKLADQAKIKTFDEEEIKYEKEYGQLADKLHTALHEVIGHASGQLEAGLDKGKIPGPQADLDLVMENFT